MFKETNKISRLKMYKQSLQQLRNELHQSSVFRSVFGMNCKTTILWSESAIFSVSGRTSPDRPNVKYLSLVVRKPAFAHAKTKTQISFAVTAKLISAFVFATRIVQSLYYLNPKSHATNRLLWLYSPVCVGPGRKPRRPVFSERGSFGSCP